jgi:hypothetical protein
MHSRSSHYSEFYQGTHSFIHSFTPSLTLQQWQFLQLPILADVESRRALSPIFLDVRRTWIFNLVDLSWRRNVGSRRQLLLLWLLLRLGCWGWLCGVRVGLYLQIKRAELTLVCICKVAKRSFLCSDPLGLLNCL